MSIQKQSINEIFRYQMWKSDNAALINYISVEKNHTISH